MASKIATTRLRKEFIKLQTDPPPGITAEPKENDILTVFYAIRGPPDTVYENGVYIGKLVFPTQYPMKPPAVYMLTPSGRFRCDKKICMSMSDFHPESWNPGWSVGTILTGIQSFMASEELTTGGIMAPGFERRKYAQQSMAYNEKHFGHLFDGDILGALERAEEAHRVASEQVKKNASSLKNSSGRRRTRNRNRSDTGSKAKEEEKEKEKEKEESTTEISTGDATKELLAKEIEKRRQKNAKKRAKQKAKKAAAAAVDEQARAMGEVSLDDKPREVSS